MPIPSHQIKKVICTGVFKVLYHRNLRWNDIKEEDISVLFTSVSNPTMWPHFFVEAVGTAIQQELVLRGSYCPALERSLVEYEGDSQTWADFEEFIKANIRNCQSAL